MVDIRKLEKTGTQSGLEMVLLVPVLLLHRIVGKS